MLTDAVLSASFNAAEVLMFVFFFFAIGAQLAAMLRLRTHHAALWRTVSTDRSGKLHAGLAAIRNLDATGRTDKVLVALVHCLRAAFLASLLMFVVHVVGTWVRQ